MVQDHDRAAQPLILVVDHNSRNLELLSQFLGQARYRVITARDGAEFEEALNGAGEISMALIDLAGFDRRVWDLCEELRARCIPLLVVSPKQSQAIEKEGLAHGAHSVLVKPLVVKELLALIRRLLEA